MTRDTEEAIVRAILAGDPDRHRRYHDSAAFRAGLRLAVQMLDRTIDGIAAEADQVDAELDAAMRAAVEATPGMRLALDELDHEDPT